MRNRFLRDEEYAAFGLSAGEGRALFEWVLEHVGYVLGSDGRGGSGVFVVTSDGRTALLTARHVVVAAILSGEVSIAAYDQGRARSKEPKALRIAMRADAALLYAPEDLVVGRSLSAADWDPSTHIDAKAGSGVIAAGAPGEWKSEPDRVGRRIEGAGTLLLCVSEHA